MSAVLNLARFQDNHAVLGSLPPSPGHHQSIYGSHTCWCVSECKFESGSCALSWTSPALTGQRPGTDSQKFHGDISEAVSEQSVWLITLIKQHSIVVRITLLNNTGVIPGNRPVESWITPVLIVRPSSLAEVTLRRVQGNRKWGSSLFPPVESGVAAHVHGAPETFVKNIHWTTARTLPKPSFKSLKCTAGRQKLAWDVCALWMASAFSYSIQTWTQEAKTLCRVRIQVLWACVTV